MLLSVMISLAILCGCSGNHPMKGRVTFEDDGTPLETGFVCFENERAMARGEIKRDGHYTVGFQNEGDGLPPGTYKIFIAAAMTPDPRDSRRVIYLVHPDQCAAATSEWSLEVNGSVRTYDLKVKRP